MVQTPLKITATMTPEELWANHHPDRKLPGSAEAENGKCGARLRSTDLKELGIVRYCANKSGKGTDHVGFGTCKFHLGSTKKHIQSATTAEAEIELKTLSQQLGEGEPLGNPEIEAWELARKTKQWSLILEKKMDELNDMLVSEDEAGIEHTRALIEILERAWERYQSMLEFLLKHDLRKRVLELEEHQARLVGQAFMTIVLSQDLKLSEAQVDIARSMFANQMSQLGPALEPSWAAGIVVEAEIIE